MEGERTIPLTPPDGGVSRLKEAVKEEDDTLCLDPIIPSKIKNKLWLYAETTPVGDALAENREAAQAKIDKLTRGKEVSWFDRLMLDLRCR